MVIASQHFQNLLIFIQKVKPCLVSSQFFCDYMPTDSLEVVTYSVLCYLSQSDLGNAIYCGGNLVVLSPNVTVTTIIKGC